MSSLNILFHSNKCEGSKILLSMMQNEKLIRFFHLICTDNNPKIPPQINITPTIVIRGVLTPYVAGDAFAWLAKIKQWKINMDIQKMNSAQQEYLKNINNNLISDNNNNILGFNQSEMAGMSDIFSFFSKNINQECQDALDQAYFSYNNIGQENIFTPPLEDGTYKTNNTKIKINENKQKDLLNTLKQDRSKQDLLIKQNVDNFINQYGNN